MALVGHSPQLSARTFGNLWRVCGFAHGCVVRSVPEFPRESHIRKGRFGVSDTTSSLDPILVSVKDAAGALGITTWSIYQLLRENKIDSRYHGKRRLIVVESLREYAAKLPTEKTEAAS